MVKGLKGHCETFQARGELNKGLRRSRSRETPRCIRRLAQDGHSTHTKSPELLNLSLEGNIGSGKSTFLKEVVTGGMHLKGLAKAVPEPVHSWQRIPCGRSEQASHNLLKEFYANPEKYAYVFQNYVFMTRFLQERESESSESTNLLKIMERSVFSDRNVFVSSVQEQGWFSELELDLYHAWSCPMIRALPCLVPDGFIYLQVAPSVCMKRLRQRARGEEIDVTLEYLESLHAKHEGWLSKNVCEVVAGDSREVLRVGSVTDEICGVFKERPVLLLVFNDVSFEEETVEGLEKKVLAFCDYVRARE